MKFEFHIDRVKPKKLPGRDLAQALEELSRLLGEPTEVHFTAIRDGSTVVVGEVGVRGSAKARSRLRDMLKTDTRRHFDRVNSIISRSGTSARLQEIKSSGRLVTLAEFPGALDKRIPLPSVREKVTVQGTLYRIEGLDQTAHAGLDDEGTKFSLVLTREQAREAAAHLFRLVRVEGEATRTRSENGDWEMGEVTAASVSPLDDTPLSQTIAELRGLGGLGWGGDTADLNDILGIERK